ncbi:tRNA glutamyl-Q(34) synthetase GluQRS [Tianweitania sp. BSSL-BM11]|uniref:tRNA glutamyl-Q(34) synthetase GluQRS n=1 Tax=Tianweitania aestuarii TaxID=2814886 RepID=A0ABS5RZH6_9HYPH|nr:tRNA glutamyl-Q(34) synthetase GluQRS [Tianweitania aestuarii]MBS9722392.1 tRNA glutamyl-Q(34) synthetase GluQRS [Tianweitania aestuarii]
MPPANRPTFRFAPSPTGRLHLGHALSAILNAQEAQRVAGRFLLRIENTDLTRCTPENEAGIYEDLTWLGLRWEEPVRRQSEHFADYKDALERLQALGLIYPSFLSRGEVRRRIADAEATGQRWPRDPDGVPLYPGDERGMPDAERQARMASGAPFAWRLDMHAALMRVGHPLSWTETGEGPAGETGQVQADPSLWGDVVLARKEFPASYTLAVVVDDALQGITHVVRGRDLFHATAVHRLLQTLLDLPEPTYHHHRLVLDGEGRKLSKSAGSQSLADLRAAGATPGDIRVMLGL